MVIIRAGDRSKQQRLVWACAERAEAGSEGKYISFFILVKTDSDEDARDFNGSKLLINEKEITPSTVVSVSDVKPVGAKVVFMLEDVRKRLPIEVQFIDKDFEVPHDVYKQSQIRRCLNNEKNLDDLSAVQTFSLFKDFIYSFFYELFHCRWKHAAEDLTCRANITSLGKATEGCIAPL